MIRIYFIFILSLTRILPGIGMGIDPPGFKNFVQTIASQDSLKVWPGMFHTYSLNEKYYWEIPLALMNRDFLVTTTVLKSAAQFNRSPEERLGYGHDMMQGSVLRFVVRNNQVDLLEVFSEETEDSRDEGLAALGRKKTGRYMTFDILHKNSHAVLIEVTKLLNTETFLVGLGRHAMDLNAGRSQSRYTHLVGIGGPQDDVLLIRSIRTYQPGRMSEKFFPGDFTLPVMIPWEIGAALFLLPEKSLPKRNMDERVEYFVDGFKSLEENGYEEVRLGVAKRWRLEPRPDEVERYKAGELVEPVKPIVFYVDRNTPDFLVPYFISAVNSWKKVFEKAGFKNAITACLEPLPEEDSLFSIADPHYSYISYQLSPRQNAYGGIISDPRSGEILCGRISIYHSFFDLVQKWYFNQCAQVDSRIHRAILPDTVMARLAEFVVTHEVGHSLGLCHNFAGSSAYSIAQIKDARFVSEHGFGASAMDYMRFNYLARPEDKIALTDLIPRVGEYDAFAIEWGYRVYPGKSEKEMYPVLRRWVSEQQRNRALRFGGMMSTDPDVQSEDLGNDVIAANTLGMENLRYIVKHWNRWRRQEPGNEDIWRGRRKWMQVQYSGFIDQVVTLIGGIYSGEQGGHQVTKEKQLQAIDFLKRYVFSKNWIFESEREQEEFCRNLIGSLIGKCVQLEHNRKNFPTTELAVGDYLHLLHQMIFADDWVKSGITSESKYLQRAYIQGLQFFCDRNVLPYVSTLCWGELRTILSEARENLKREKDCFYWEGVIVNIEFWMNK